MEPKKENEFERGLREILSAGDHPREKKEISEKIPLQTVHQQASAHRRSTTLIFAIIRIVAALALVMFLLMFIFQISNR